LRNTATARGDLRAKLSPVLELLARDPASLSSIRDPEQAWRVHVEDSLSGLELVEQTVAAEPGAASGAGPSIADVGSGAGFPGLPLAAALPGAAVDLIESIGRKCEFARRAIEAAGIANAAVICERAESWALPAAPGRESGREGYDVVTARAVGRLVTLAELASPLLREGGALIAWKGRRQGEEEAELARASERLAMRHDEARWVGSYAGSRNRHLHVIRKVGPTPEGLPRRPGMAKSRPFGRGGL
jgi:16S rRNA (guanine527-N7)-methyltransferase